MIDAAIRDGIREVDILLGFLAPLLAEQTTKEQATKCSLPDSLSNFSLKLIEQLRGRLQKKSNTSNSDVLLVAQSLNSHNLGVQLLELWLNAELISTKSLIGSDEEILSEFKKQNYKILGISLAERSHLPEARNLIKKIKNEREIPY